MPLCHLDPSKTTEIRVEPLSLPGFDVPFDLRRGEAIATVGPCFARHVETELLRLGFKGPMCDLFADPSFTALTTGILNNDGAPSIYNELAWAFGKREFVPANPDRFRPHVPSFEEIQHDLTAALDIARKFGHLELQVLLTVSPVPLTATHRNQDVIVANCYSKSVLRAVAETMCASYGFCRYYPSHESVTLSAGHLAWDDDLDHSTKQIVALNVDRMVTAFVEADGNEAVLEITVSNTTRAIELARAAVLVRLGRADQALARLDRLAMPTTTASAICDAMMKAALATKDALMIAGVAARHVAAVPKRAPAIDVSVGHCDRRAGIVPQSSQPSGRRPRPTPSMLQRGSQWRKRSCSSAEPMRRGRALPISMPRRRVPTSCSAGFSASRLPFRHSG